MMIIPAANENPTTNQGELFCSKTLSRKYESLDEDDITPGRKPVVDNHGLNNPLPITGEVRAKVPEAGFFLHCDRSFMFGLRSPAERKKASIFLFNYSGYLLISTVNNEYLTILQVGKGWIMGKLGCA